MSEQANPQPNRRPEFMQVFDGTQPQVPEEEQAQVAIAFKKFVDDKFVEYKNAVYPARMAPNWETSKLETVTPTELPEPGSWKASFVGSAVHVGLTQDQPSVYTSETRTIYLEFIDQNKAPREDYTYSLDREGVVYREDLEDALDPNSPTLLFPDRHMSDDYEERVNAFYDDVAEGVKNTELERTMGLDYQPIGMAELNGLIELLNSPGTVPLSPAG